VERNLNVAAGKGKTKKRDGSAFFVPNDPLRCQSFLQVNQADSISYQDITAASF